MWDLAMSILFSSVLFVVFKLFSVLKIETFYAIVANYFVAGLVSTFFYTKEVSTYNLSQKSWFWGTLALGILFILVFNVMAKTAQNLGVSVASVATKMSFVIPVVFGVWWYQEKVTLLNAMGICLAVVAVYLCTLKDQKLTLETRTLLLPLLVFLGSGFIDAGIKFLQEQQMEPTDYPLFSTVVFFGAAGTGSLFMLVNSHKRPLKINIKNLLGGIILGVPNYFSIHFLLRALKSETLNSASVFTVNNVAIVLLSTLLGIVLFKERLNFRNWTGVLLAVVSILLVLLF
ncbi:EamA family transporter [Arenibacter sp. GZD96]|uniref:EamA family transporter n=1 Tax=Aurantibrevibacter litoralis TaxID=3106030 RepID=UPI002B0039EE|nr:EamA family transporter [Arenibacter sp. GZD-96]MEA1786327.1 EamA family transporter [Arenibacter sp. GZD-96]